MRHLFLISAGANDEGTLQHLASGPKQATRVRHMVNVVTCYVEENVNFCPTTLFMSKVSRGTIFCSDQVYKTEEGGACVYEAVSVARP